ncbi:MAG: hypothetical protein JXB00_09110 [Bacteroidales bacterium]|nr:hypothetical protein [Bacteroidales bacterium]
MKTKVCQIRLLSFGIVFLSFGIVSAELLRAQQDKTGKNQPDIKIDVKREFDEKGNVKSYDSVYSFSWSSEGDINIDSVLKSLHGQFGISPFGFDEPFSMPFDRFRGYNERHVNDSLFGYINPGDSVYRFNPPADDFGFPDMFRDPFFEDFFNDPFFGNRYPPFRHADPFFYAPSDSSTADPYYFDMRSMLEEHIKRMEEFHKHFQFNEPFYFEMPDSVAPKPRKQNNSHRNNVTSNVLEI